MEFQSWKESGEGRHREEEAQPGSPGDEASTLSPQACDSKRDALASLNSETGPGKKISGEEELESLQRMVQELQKEIETQKQMYEEQIKK